ncbi:hypothetical protein [Streptomyces sp. NBC_01190]|uniref:hypothetical protein n=1 Tax=Streptomyces sp. NBC_01190 TaxID=2903767 RepID=UPI00386303AC|nr:hypothetical protein OG519_29185 [Streptomyces sp. NBC_01190]
MVPTRFRRTTGRRTVRRTWSALVSALALGAVALAGAPAAHAGPQPVPWVYYVGDDGALWGFTQQTDGSWTTAAPQGPTGQTLPGGHVAATRIAGGLPSVFFVGVDGAVYQDCPLLTKPVAVTATRLAPPGAAITAEVVGGQITVTAARQIPQGKAVAAAPRTPPALAPAAAPHEISNPCSPPVNVRFNTSSTYAGGAMTSVGTSGGYHDVLFVDTAGAVRVQWQGPQGSTLSEKALTAPGTAKPGGGVTAVNTQGLGLPGSALTLFFTGHDGRVRVAHTTEQGSLTGSVQPNTTGTADAPDGAPLSAVAGAKGLAVGYAASDGAFSVAYLTPTGAWQKTFRTGAAGDFASGAPSAATAAADGDYDWYCGNGLRVPVHLHGPLPGPKWVDVGLPNVVVGASFAAV